LYNVLQYSDHSYPGPGNSKFKAMKKIDTIAMIRSIRDQQNKDTLGKSPQETIIYYRNKAACFTKKKKLK